MTLASRWTLALFGALVLASHAPAHAAPPQPRTPGEATVVALLDLAFNQKKPDEAFGTYVGATYRQHNPTVADGKAAILEALHGWLPTVPQLHYEMVRIISSADLVVVHSHVTTSSTDPGMAVVDIFRLEDGKVVEHWDVSQPVPASAANTNTMF